MCSLLGGCISLGEKCLVWDTIERYLTIFSLTSCKDAKIDVLLLFLCFENKARQLSCGAKVQVQCRGLNEDDFHEFDSISE